MGDWLRKRHEYGKKWRKSYALPKDKVLVRGRRRLGKFSWEREGSSELTNLKEVRLLGELLTDVVGRSPNQVMEAVASMREKVDNLKWMTTV